MRAVEQSEIKHAVYPIGEAEKAKSQKFGQKKGPTKGLEPTWVCMSKGLDLFT
jgi:hypothetical protein